jgi:hypothetical protein
VLHQFSLQSYLLHTRKCLGHRAVALGGLVLLQKKVFVDAGNLSLCTQLDPADGVPLPERPKRTLASVWIRSGE